MVAKWTMHYLVIGGLILLCLCSCESDDDDSIKIYVGGAVSLTGTSATPSWTQAMLLAASHANEGLQNSGGSSRIQFETVSVDSQNKGDVAVTRALEMVTKSGIKAVLNGTSGETTSLVKTFYDSDKTNHLGIPVLCMSCSSPSLHDPAATDKDPAVQEAYRNKDGWLFGFSMSATPQARVLVNVITAESSGDRNKDGKTKVSILAIDDTFGNGFSSAIKTALQASVTSANLIVEQLVHPKTLDVSSYDWAGAMSKMNDKDPGNVSPDYIIEVTFAQQTVALLRAYKQGGYTTPFFHTHTARENAVRVQAGTNMEGQEGTSYTPLDGTAGDIFEKAFKARFNTPIQSQWDSHSYDATMSAMLAVLVASRGMEDPSQVTGTQVRDALKTINDSAGKVIQPGAAGFEAAVKAIEQGQPINYQGASGPCDFDKNGRAANKLVHWKFASSEYKIVNTYDCITSSSTCPKIAK